jgi:hypothetical protein
VPVGDEVVAVVLRLEPFPVLQRPDEMAEVERPRRANARHHTLPFSHSSQPNTIRCTGRMMAPSTPVSINAKQAKALAKTLADPKFVEMFDGKLFHVAVDYLDDNLGEKLPAQFKEDTNALVKAVIEKDVDKVQLYSARILNTLIDVPYLTEDAEAILIGAVMEGLVKVIQDWVKKNAEK